MLALVRIRDIAANAGVIMDEHAAYAESHAVVNASDHRAPASTLITWRMS